ncbi:hypothetical protein LguiB_023511 [Lonicera macranthoides]
MRKSSKRSRKEVQESESGSDDEVDFMEEDRMLNVEDEEEGDDSENFDDTDNEDEGRKNSEMEELEKEYMNIRHEEQDILKNLTRHKDEDLLKGQAVKNQKALWDKTLEFRFLLQKAFSNSNRLPQEAVRSSFCDSGDEINDAYSDLVTSSKKTLDSILELQEALLEKNPSIIQAADGNNEQNVKRSEASTNLNEETDEEWSQISQMHSRMASFRDKSIDKWQRKTQVTTGAAAIKGRLQAFNQNISEQVAAYMRDPSRMVKGMQQRKSTFPIFGTGVDSDGKIDGEDTNVDGDPELLDDSEFYQQLLKEFFESCDSTSSETAFYALKRLQTKKRKIVDRRASKSRKIRYNIHEKIVNFMAPQPTELPPMAPKLFENLFGLKTHKPTTVV